MSTIGVGAPGTGQINKLQDVAPVGQPQTGSGVNAPNGGVPEPGRQTYSMVMESLSAMLTPMSPVDVEVLLIQVAVEMKEAESTGAKEKIKVDQEAKRTALLEKDEKLEEAGTKIEEAIEERENASIFDKIKLAFEFLGAILMIAVGVLLLATGAGTAVGALMIAGGVVSLIMAIDSAVQMGTGQGIMGNIVYLAAKADGKSEEEAKDMASKADMGFRIGMAVIGIALAIGGGVGAFYAAPAAAAKLGTQAAQTAQTIAKMASSVDNAMNVVTAGADIGAGVYRYEATKHDAEANELKADGTDKQALAKMLDDFIDQALARLIASSDRFNAILDNITDAIQDRGETLSKTRFQG